MMFLKYKNTEHAAKLAFGLCILSIFIPTVTSGITLRVIKARSVTL